MKKAVFIIFFVSVMLLLSACKMGNLGGNNQKTPQTPTSVSDITGTQGYVAQFVRNMPPDFMYFENGIGDLPVGVELMNKGTDQGEVYVFVTGFDKSIITSAINNRLQFDSNGLDPVDIYNPSGGYAIAQPRAHVSLPEGVENFPVTFLLTTCFSYQTKASPLICLDPEIYGFDTGQKACSIQDVTLTSQGAPIAITGVTVKMLSNKKAQIRVDIQNAGGGTVLDQDRLSEVCSGSKFAPDKIGAEDLDRVYIESVSIGADSGGYTNLKCIPTEKIILNNGQGAFTCLYDLPSNSASAYKTALNIRLSYGYKLTSTKDVQLLRINSQ